ncbi:hypothetical protein ACFQV8_31705 [Pseudonocardia benzenivorans]
MSAYALTGRPSAPLIVNASSAGSFSAKLVSCTANVYPAWVADRPSDSTAATGS